MKTMNIKTLVCVSAILLTTFISCKKNKDAVPEPKPTVVGFWEGQYGVGNSDPSLYYAFLFRASGTVRVYSGNADTAAAIKAEGTYVHTGNTVTTTYFTSKDFSYSTTASANAALSTMEGSWKDNALGLNKGGFSISKK